MSPSTRKQVLCILEVVGHHYTTLKQRSNLYILPISYGLFGLTGKNLFFSLSLCTLETSRYQSSFKIKIY